MSLSQSYKKISHFKDFSWTIKESDWNSIQLKIIYISLKNNVKYNVTKTNPVYLMMQQISDSWGYEDRVSINYIKNFNTIYLYDVRGMA